MDENTASKAFAAMASPPPAKQPATASALGMGSPQFGRDKTIADGPCANMFCPHGFGSAVLASDSGDVLCCTCSGSQDSGSGSGAGEEVHVCIGKHTVFHRDCLRGAAHPDTRLKGVPRLPKPSRTELGLDKLQAVLAEEDGQYAGPNADAHACFKAPTTDAVLRMGRSMHRSKYTHCHAGQMQMEADQRWKTVPSVDRELTSLHLLGEHAVLCPSCFVMFRNGVRQSSRAGVAGERLRAHARRVIVHGVRKFVVHLQTLEILMPIAALFTLLVCLKVNTRKRMVWFTTSTRDHNKPTASFTAMHGAGMLTVIAALGLLGAQLAGSQAAGGYDGVRAVLAAHKLAHGDAFWACAAELLRDKLLEFNRTRLAQIQAVPPTLHGLTSWARDWHRTPTCLRAFFSLLLHSRAQAQDSLMSATREQQKSRDAYLLMIMALHSLDARMCFPVHKPLAFLAFYAGQSAEYRSILAHMNVIVSNELERTTRHIANAGRDDVATRWIMQHLLAFCFFMFVHDNLDWMTGGIQRAPDYSTSKVSKPGTHIVNRMVRSPHPVPAYAPYLRVTKM